MKKLLTVLSSLSIFVAAPLTVIACRTTTNNNPGEMYDYTQWRNHLVSEITEIVNTQVNNQFTPYFFISKNDPSFSEFENLNFDRIISLLGNSNSQEIPVDHELFSSFNREIMSLVRWGQIIEMVRNQVTTNINYRPLLIDNRNPLQGDLRVSQIRLTKQGKDSMATIFFTLSASIFIRDQNGDTAITPVNAMTRISFFSNEQEQKNVVSFMDNLRRELMKPEVANSFKFVSSSGDLKRNIRNLRSTNVKDYFKSFINKTITDDNFGLKNLEIDSNRNINFNTAEQAVVTGTSGSWRTNSTWFDPQPGDATMLKAALLNGGKDLKDLIEETLKVTDQVSIFGVRRASASGEIINQLTENDFWWFNHLYLANIVSNNRNPMFSSILRNSGANFEISKDTTIDGRAIAAYPVAVNNLALTFESVTQDKITIEIPELNIFVKQYSREANSKELIRNWLDANLEMYREMFGFVSKTNNGEDNLAIKMPDEFKNVFQFDRIFDTQSFMQALARETANKMLTRREDINQELIAGFSIDTFGSFNARIKFSKANSNLYFILPNSDTVLFNQNLGLRYNFFSDQQFNHSANWGISSLRLSIGGQRVIRSPRYGIDTSGIIITDFN